ncbi:MAG: serine hydrolase [Bacteroidetes bacterium]|nr:serine hydrolase [Bacteroidota bacterium]
MKKISAIFFIILASTLKSQFSFESIFRTSPVLQKAAENHVPYRLQIIYTQIDRDENGTPHFKNYYYHTDSSLYFYCASLVKLPTSILALESLNELGLDRNTIMFTDSANACQHTCKKDTSSETGYPSLAHYIRKMALVSDNLAFGRVYEFVGVDHMHDRLQELGFPNMRIVHRFDGGCKGTENITTNPVSFYNKDLKLIMQRPQQTSTHVYTNPIGQVLVGKAYYNAQNKKINQPKDFTNMNYIALKDIHEMLRRLVFQPYTEKSRQYNIRESDRLFLLDYLTRYPSQSDYPHYDPKTYYDSYKKYFIFGDSKKPITDSSLSITNIVGQSYGFMSDCAYIRNKTKHVEFMLSAVIYANADEIINDGKYEYNTVALPFLAELGRRIYAYELTRKR